jgi:hypothetical protein
MASSSHSESSSTSRGEMVFSTKKDKLKGKADGPDGEVEKS